MRKESEEKAKIYTGLLFFACVISPVFGVFVFFVIIVCEIFNVFEN